MKTVGFRNKHDYRIVKEDFIKEPAKDSAIILSDEEKKRLVYYLKNNEHTYEITLWLKDGDNSIGPYMIHSDGEWAWPSHLAYYIQKNDFSSLNEEFIMHVMKNNFEVQKLSTIQRHNLEKFLLDTLLR